MKFLVKSGNHSKSIEAIDFNQAAIQFVEGLKSNEIGHVISVTCEVTETWIRSEDVIQSINNPKSIRIV